MKLDLKEAGHIEMIHNMKRSTRQIMILVLLVIASILAGCCWSMCSGELQLNRTESTYAGASLEGVQDVLLKGQVVGNISKAPGTAESRYTASYLLRIQRALIMWVLIMFAVLFFGLFVYFMNVAGNNIATLIIVVVLDTLIVIAGLALLQATVSQLINPIIIHTTVIFTYVAVVLVSIGLYLRKKKLMDNRD